MTGKVLDLRNILNEDLLATRLTERFIEWDTLRQPWKVEKEEIRRYGYATDTTKTTNAQLPWKNKTTIPKLTQISDNLYANYTATLFPQRKWLIWEANERDADSAQKRDAITNYMQWAISQPSFKHEMDKIILDYIHFGNCFATVEWVDQRIEMPTKVQGGYIGPAIKRISPLDMVMNPTAENFLESPKFVRSLISLGELKSMLEKMSNDENRDSLQKLYTYLQDIRFHARSFVGDWIQRDRLYAVDGFSSFRAYLLSDFVEVLTFYGDWYDYYTDTFQKNRVITVVDRHKLIDNKPNPSYFGYPPIYHVPWRKKTDNLWGMGPPFRSINAAASLKPGRNEITPHTSQSPAVRDKETALANVAAVRLVEPPVLVKYSPILPEAALLPLVTPVMPAVKTLVPLKVLLPLRRGTVAPEVPTGGTVIVGLDVTSIIRAGELTLTGAGRLMIGNEFMSKTAFI